MVSSIGESGHLALNRRLWCRCKRQQGKTRQTSVVTVQVQGVLDRGNPYLGHNLPGGRGRGFLLGPGQGYVIVSPSRVDFEANRWRWSSKPQHPAAGSYLKRVEEGVRSPD